MLVLARKVNQSIVIDENTVITIKEISSDGVKLAIEAPKNIKIMRKELVDSVVADNKDALVNASRANMKHLLENSLKKENKK